MRGPTTDFQALEAFKSSLRNRIAGRHEIARLAHTAIHTGYGFSNVTICWLDSAGNLDTCWPSDSQYLDGLAQWIAIANKQLDSLGAPLIDSRSFCIECTGNPAVWGLLNDDNLLIGLVLIDSSQSGIEARIVESLNEVMTEIAGALDSALMHQKIESLLIDKQELEKRIQKDEETLKSRMLEMSVLYDTSSALSNVLNYYEVVSHIMDAIYRVLSVDICTILLLEFTRGGELFMRINHPVDESLLKDVQNNVLNTSRPFIRRILDVDKISFLTEKQFVDSGTEFDGQLRSFANVPLPGKHGVIGILNVCSTKANAFARNETTFLHTISNQLSSHLGRLLTIREIEKSKIGTVIYSMTEGVIVLDEDNHVDIINPAAIGMLGLSASDPPGSDQVIAKMLDINIMPLYTNALISNEPILNQEVIANNCIFSVNVTPVTDSDKKRIGMVLVFRDVTEWQMMNRINAQRLEVISQVNSIINSIGDLDRLLTFLIEFILKIASAEMGSIQLRQPDGQFLTRIHSNFPDKIRLEYQFVDGQVLSDYASRIGSTLVIAPFDTDDRVKHDTKIKIQAYICIPIRVKSDIIGVINIVRKSENRVAPLSDDDIETLQTITTLSGTAIQNALLYQATLQKQKLDQELKVAHEIQQNLLTSYRPNTSNFQFGVISCPAREIGGDYYDFFELDADRIAIIVADIVGKGIPAALVMVMVKSIFQTHIRSCPTPKALAEKMNTLIFQDHVIHKYVPTFIGMLNRSTREFIYCNAGHEPGFVFTHKKTISLDTNGMPLGAFLDGDYEEKSIYLTDDDILALFTDGIIEARNSAGIDYGLSRLKSKIKRCRTLPAQALVESLVDDIQVYSKETIQHDDLTLVLIKVGAHQLESEVPISAKEITVKSTKSAIGVVRKIVEESARSAGFDDAGIFDIKLAINEAQANIVEHAYHGNPDNDIIVSVTTYENRLEVVLKDFGLGQGQKTIKGKPHLGELEGSGLGVFLINDLMDVVESNRSTSGTVLKIIKFLRGESNGNIKNKINKSRN